MKWPSRAVQISLNPCAPPIWQLPARRGDPQVLLVVEASRIAAISHGEAIGSSLAPRHAREAFAGDQRLVRISIEVLRKTRDRLQTLRCRLPWQLGPFNEADFGLDDVLAEHDVEQDETGCVHAVDLGRGDGW